MTHCPCPTSGKDMFCYFLGEFAAVSSCEGWPPPERGETPCPKPWLPEASRFGSRRAIVLSHLGPGLFLWLAEAGIRPGLSLPLSTPFFSLALSSTVLIQGSRWPTSAYHPLLWELSLQQTLPSSMCWYLCFSSVSVTNPFDFPSLNMIY